MRGIIAAAVLLAATLGLSIVPRAAVAATETPTETPTDTPTATPTVSPTPSPMFTAPAGCSDLSNRKDILALFDGIVRWEGEDADSAMLIANDLPVLPAWPVAEWTPVSTPPPTPPPTPGWRVWQHPAGIPLEFGDTIMLRLCRNTEPPTSSPTVTPTATVTPMATPQPSAEAVQTMGRPTVAAGTAYPATVGAAPAYPATPVIFPAYRGTVMVAPAHVPTVAANPERVPTLQLRPRG